MWILELAEYYIMVNGIILSKIKIKIKFNDFMKASKNINKA